MLTRIREEYDATGDTSQAIALGLSRTGKLVTSARSCSASRSSCSPLAQGPTSSSSASVFRRLIFDATVIGLARAVADVAARELELYFPPWAARSYARNRGLMTL